MRLDLTDHNLELHLNSRDTILQILFHYKSYHHLNQMSSTVNSLKMQQLSEMQKQLAKGYPQLSCCTPRCILIMYFIFKPLKFSNHSNSHNYLLKPKNRIEAPTCNNRGNGNPKDRNIQFVKRFLFSQTQHFHPR